MNCKKNILVLLIFCLSSLVFSQSKNADSLLKSIHHTKADTNQIKVYQKVYWIYMGKGLVDSGFKYANKVFALSKKLNYTKGLAGACNTLGQVYDYRGSFDSAIYYFTEAKHHYEKLKDVSRIAGMLNNLGVVYKAHGNIPKALSYFFQALKVKEQFKDTSGMANSYLNIGSLYSETRDDQNTLKYYLRALELRLTLNDPSDLANSFLALGSFYSSRGNLDTALVYLQKALKISEQLEDQESTAIESYNIGNVYYLQNKITEAEKLFERSLTISKNNNNYDGISNCQLMLGQIAFDQKETSKAINLFEAAYSAALKMDAKELIASTSYNLSKAYGIVKNYEKAFNYHQIWSTVKDSLYNQENIRKLTSEGLKYEYEKEKILNQIEQEKVEATRKAEAFKKDLITGASILFLITVSIFSFIIFKRLKENRKQKNVIEQQRNEMIDSINYAKRIQFALLAHDDLLKNNLPEHFVYFKPKDIVSGDFYWATKKDDFFYLAICDSTGHGVPGAFMSLLNISFLNEAINEKNISEPHEVLNHVRQRLIQNMDGGQDGMDAVLIKIDCEPANLKVEYAAANNSPFLIRNDHSIDLTKDKMPIGKGESNTSFKLQVVDLQKGDYLYIYTDGFADQFGGEKGKKFKYKQLEQLLLAICNLPSNEQKIILDKKFEEWRGSLEQVDDVCIMGIKF